MSPTSRPAGSPPPPSPKRGAKAASTIAQILGDVILHHTPWTAEVSEKTRRRITDEWLDGLEAHATTVIGPLIEKLGEGVAMPKEIADLLDHVAVPKAAFGSTIQQFFIYGVMFSLASTALQPFTQVVSNELWKANPTRPLSPPDLATLVVRGLEIGGTPTTVAPDWSKEMAAESGLSAENFQALVDATGMPPAPQELYQMIRRQIIDEAQLDQGLREGDTRDEWIPALSKLRYATPSPTDLVAAAIRYQMPYDDAKAWAEEFGLEPPGWINNNPDWFKVLYDTGGRPIAPVEAGHAALRGFIPWEGTGPEALSFQQSIAEGDLKTKWTGVLEKLAYYYPPNGEIMTLLKHGAITRAQAVAYFNANGVPTELAQAYLYISTYQQTETDLALAKGDIESLVQENIISDEEAIHLLERVGYTGDSANLLVEMAHWRYNMEALRSSINRIATLYVEHKISATDCKAGIAALGLPAAQVDQLMATYEIQHQHYQPVLTPAQIASGLYYSVLTQSEAMQMLEGLGYEPDTAWRLLSIRMHGPLPNPPPGITLPGQQGTAGAIKAAELAVETALGTITDTTSPVYADVMKALDDLMKAGEVLNSIKP